MFELALVALGLYTFDITFEDYFFYESVSIAELFLNGV